MFSLTEQERRKYLELYEGSYPRTGYAIDAAEFIKNTARKGDHILDMGTGHGSTVLWLRERGFNCKGIDITRRGLPSEVVASAFYEAPLWDMPFDDSFFDYTFSVDVLEHIPPTMVEATIKEIYRITRVETFHCIATIDDPNYPNVHLTIAPIQWWKKKFKEQNNKKVDTHIVNPEELWLLCHYVNKRRVG